jgi:hypothetical protein
MVHKKSGADPISDARGNDGQLIVFSRPNEAKI